MFWLFAASLWAEPSKTKAHTSAFGYESILVDRGSFEMGTMRGDIDESVIASSFKSTLRSQIGYCGVVEPQLGLLQQLLKVGAVSWSGLRIST